MRTVPRICLLAISQLRSAMLQGVWLACCQVQCWMYYIGDSIGTGVNAIRIVLSHGLVWTTNMTIFCENLQIINRRLIVRAPWFLQRSIFMLNTLIKISINTYKTSSVVKFSLSPSGPEAFVSAYSLKYEIKRQQPRSLNLSNDR